jgi:hypothetical protein
MYRNTKTPATETNVFSKRLIKEHTCRVNGGELGHLAEKKKLHAYDYRSKTIR